MFKHFCRITIGLTALLSFGKTLYAAELKLWYEQPARTWEEALPLGNGRLGAMVFGGVDKESIQLNEDTFWAGGPHNNLNPAARTALPEIRRLIASGKHAQASALAEKSISSQGAQGMPYQSAGVVDLHFPGHETFQNYYRDLSLTDAVARVRYTVNGVNFQREVFTSFVDQAVVIRLRAERKGALNFSVGLSHPDGMAITTRENELLMQGISVDHEGIKGQVKLANLARLAQTDGSVRVKGKRLQISDATEALLLITMATNFVNYRDISGNALARAEQAMQNATAAFASADYENRRKAHEEFYRGYFQRVSLDLGENEFALEPTDKRIREFSGRNDPALVALYFQFGRYLLISSSQPGTQPANLQGIWNPHSQPPWDSKYTLKINAQMN